MAVARAGGGEERGAGIPGDRDPGGSRARRRLSSGVLLASSVALALLPAVLIVLAYWRSVEPRPVLPQLDGLWARLPYLRKVVLPSYFLVVLLSYVILLVLFLARRRDPAPWAGAALTRTGRRVTSRGRASSILFVSSALALVPVLIRIVVRRMTPGWEMFAPILLFGAGALLAEASPTALVRLAGRWIASAVRVSALPVAVLLAAALLQNDYSGAWLALLLPLAAAVVTLRFRKRVPVWVWIVALALAVRVLFLGAWWYSLIGDEYAFWLSAKDILLRQNAAEVNLRLFSNRGAYDQHPYLGAMVQAGGMVFGGIDNFGWKLSGLVLAAVAIPLYFSFFRVFAGRRVAGLAAFLLASSHYLMSFSKIGYNNLQADFSMALVLGAAGFAARTRRRLAYVCLGFAMATCFYSYPAALYCLPLPVLLLAIYDPPRTRAAIGRWLDAGVAALLVAFPLFMDPEFTLSKAGGVVVANDYIQGTGISPTAHVALNVFYTAMSHLFKPGSSHFVAISYQDPLSAVLLALGVCVVLRRLPRDRFALFLTIGWGILVLACSTHGSDYPPTTRMFLMLPFFSLFGAIGLAWLLDRLRSLGAPPAAVRATGAFVLAAVLALNLYQAYVLSPRRMTMYQGIEEAFVRVASKARAYTDEPGRHFIFVTKDWTVDYGFYDLRDVYRLPPVFDMKLEGDHLPAGAGRLLRQQSAIVFIRPELPENVRLEVGEELRRDGKFPCPVENLAGRVQLVAWQSDAFPPLCR